MKTVHLELPGQLAWEVDTLVNKGWFVGESKAARFALRELVHRQRSQPFENQRRDDIAWAKDLKGNTA